jgi:uroporphyrin-III C-methyltransferase
MRSLGKVFLVGAGPGAADLITVRGAALLAAADIVLHDALIEPEMLALCKKAKLIPVGKRCGKLSTAQRFINKMLVDAAQKYATVVRLKGGDPMLFGRADEELSALDGAGIAYEIVPGITSALAGAASLGRSLTLRGVSRSIAFITHAKAESDANQPKKLFENPSADTLIYYMGRSHASTIGKQLLGQGRAASTPVHILEAISTKRERKWSMSLFDLASLNTDHEPDESTWQQSDEPLLILIGEALAERASAKLNNGLQDSFTLTNSRRRA